MELCKQILTEAFRSGIVEVRFPDLECDLSKIVESTCYQALKEIKEILNDDTLTDEDCFNKIEEIVCVLEDYGMDGGSRHDFG